MFKAVIEIKMQLKMASNIQTNLQKNHTWEVHKKNIWLHHVPPRMLTRKTCSQGNVMFTTKLYSGAMVAATVGSIQGSVLRLKKITF